MPNVTEQLMTEQLMFQVLYTAQDARNLSQDARNLAQDARTTVSVA